MGLGGKWMLLVPRREGDLIGTKNRGIPRECWDHEGHIVLGDRVIEKTLQRGGWNKIREWHIPCLASHFLPCSKHPSVPSIDLTPQKSAIVSCDTELGREREEMDLRGRRQVIWTLGKQDAGTVNFTRSYGLCLSQDSKGRELPITKRGLYARQKK